MNNIVYSIGYTAFDIDDFIDVLKEYKIDVVIDVRSYPYSKRYPEYNRDKLSAQLKDNNIYYRNYDKEFGARQKNKAFYNKNGILDFDKFSKSDQFLEGIEKISYSMSKGYTFVLLCAEKRPITCHRTILVSKAFFDRGYRVEHILENRRTISQEEINNMLLDKFFPDRNQINLFHNSKDDVQLINEAYKKQNAEIGYKMEDE